MMEMSRRGSVSVRASGKMCAVAATVQHLLCGGHHSGSAAVRGAPGDRLGLGGPR